MNTVKHQGEKWYEFADVYVRLQKDELGYPPKEWEQLKAAPTDKEDVYRLESVPVYDRRLAYHDEVRVTTSPEGYSPVFESPARRSGYSTMRLWIKDEEDRKALVDYFTGKDCLLEFEGHLVAIAIPKNSFEVVSDHICAEKERGRWDAEDGYLAVDELNS